MVANLAQRRAEYRLVCGQTETVKQLETLEQKLFYSYIASELGCKVSIVSITYRTHCD